MLMLLSLIRYIDIISIVSVNIYILSVYSPFFDRVGLPLHNIHIPSPFTSIMDILVPTISAYTRWNCLATVCNYRCQQIEINSYPDSPLFISTGFLPRVSSIPAELIGYMITKLQRRQPDQTHLKLLQMSGDVHPNPGPARKYPCPVCTRNVTSRGVSYKCTKCYGWVRAKCSGILNAAQYRRKGDWTCDACLAPVPAIATTN